MLATVEEVRWVHRHPNADRLDMAGILGYQCVVGRDQFQPGDRVLLVQPDALLPSSEPWATPFLAYTSRGRVKAVKLRKEWSMGLVVELDAVRDFVPADVETGVDVSEALGVTKYEAPLPKNLDAKGGLPFGVPRTDEERWQNLDQPGHGRPISDLFGEIVDVTLKIDGSSLTAFCALPEHFPAACEDGAPAVGICSRSLELKMQEGVTNPWIEAARSTGVLAKLRSYCREHGVSLALRGEVYGQGVQTLGHNPHCRLPRGVAFFSVWNILEHRYERKGSEHYFFNVCQALGLPTVEFLEENVPLMAEMLTHYGDEISQINGQPFEGVVIQGEFGSFKIVNKAYDSRK